MINRLNFDIHVQFRFVQNYKSLKYTANDM